MSFHLKGFNSVKDTTLNNEIQDNMVEFFDWALLKKGNYFNVTLGETAPNGYDYSKLRLSSDERFTAGTCWEGVRNNWVWQSGVNYSPAPLVGTNNTKPGISGVYVDDTFYPTTTTGDYAHHVDYFNGRVLFDSPIPTGSKVQVEHSYKWINVVYANSVPWLREVQYRSYDINGEFLQAAKGDWDMPPEARLQLPAIAIEIVPRRTITGYQLGGGSYVDTDVLFHCLAEDEMTRNKLVDIVSLQNDKTFYAFNSNSIAASGDFPLDYKGSPVSGAMNFEELVLKHYGPDIRLKNSSVQGMDVINSNFCAGIVKLTAEVIKTNV
jgi:hypothetical protein|tara:strand:- start:537 stop:1505 length:969 start_codon:yes stop_codon:yes gene_type:complete